MEITPLGILKIGLILVFVIFAAIVIYGIYGQ